MRVPSLNFGIFGTCNHESRNRNDEKTLNKANRLRRPCKRYKPDKPNQPNEL